MFKENVNIQKLLYITNILREQTKPYKTRACKTNLGKKKNPTTVYAPQQGPHCCKFMLYSTIKIK